MAITESSSNNRPLPNPLLLTFLFSHTFSSFFFFSPVSSYSGALDFIYGGCSHQKYAPGSPYESNLDSLLTSIVNSAAFSSYNNFTVSGASPPDVVYGLYQCRGDLSMPDCAACVAQAVTRASALCSGTCGGAVQLEGCYVKYDNATFLGVEDTTVVLKKCGPSAGYEPGPVGRMDAVLASLAGTAGPYRVGGSGEAHGVAQCVGDLSVGECQDCISEAVERLRSECGAAVYGNMYLTKCYAKYSTGGVAAGGGGYTAPVDENKSSDEGEKTFAILIGLLAGVVLLVIFLTFLRKTFKENDGK